MVANSIPKKCNVFNQVTMELWTNGEGFEGVEGGKDVEGLRKI
jgi:hypothetical protein